MSDYIKVEESYVDALIQNAAWGAAKVKLDEALSAGQKKLDTDKDGKIEGEDLAKLRKGKAKKEAMDPKEKVKEAAKAKMKKEAMDKDDMDEEEDEKDMKESVEAHTCPLCESVLEEELSDEQIFEHVNDILEAVQTLEEAKDEEDMDEEEEEEVEEAMDPDADEDPDEMAMNASRKKKTDEVMKKVKELKKSAKKGK
jgi:hypothetical protein